jgi:hypothetical protein
MHLEKQILWKGYSANAWKLINIQPNLGEGKTLCVFGCWRDAAALDIGESMQLPITANAEISGAFPSEEECYLGAALLSVMKTQVITPATYNPDGTILMPAISGLVETNVLKNGIFVE